MAMALPVVGALAGAGAAWGLGFTSLTALTIGASVGWLVGSWVMYSQMDPIGGANEVIDPGAQEMPRFNTAVRGAIVPVLFGTNRVPAQIVWQQNFEAIRHETQSAASNGGKSGGSGGGKGVQTGGSVQVSYTYKIDAVYHLGLVPRAVKLLGGWLGGERVSDGSITELGMGSSGDGFQWVASDPDSGQVGISYDEGTFFEGLIEEENDWDHLTSQVGQPIAWPGTAWVGFKGLSMGTTATMPQLSFELGPKGTGIEFESAWRGTVDYTVSDFDNSISGIPSGRIDRYGNAWVNNYNGNEVVVVSNQGVELAHYSQAEIRALVFGWAQSNYAAIWAELNNGQPVLDYCLFVCPVGGNEDQERILVATKFASNGFSDSPYKWVFTSCTADDSGNLTPHGMTMARGAAAIEDSFFAVSTPFTAVGDELNSPIVFGAANLPDDSYFTVIPSINGIEGTYSNGNCTLHQWNTPGGDYAGWFCFENWQAAYFANQNYENAAFILPRVTIDPLVSMTEPVYHAGIYKYIPRNAAYQATLGTIGDLPPALATMCTGDFANGGLTYTKIDIWHDDDDFVYTGSAPTAHTLADPQFIDGAFVDVDGNAYDNFDEEWLTFLGDDWTWGMTINGDTWQPPAYFVAPSYIERKDNGAFLCIFLEPLYIDPMYYDSAIVGDVNEVPLCTRVRAFIYNPSPDVYKFYEQAKVKGYFATSQDANAGVPVGPSSIRYYDPVNVTLDLVDGDLVFYLHHGPVVTAMINNGATIVGLLGTVDEGGSDEYPPYIIRQILTNEWFGLQPGGDIIDEASYQAALSFCEENNIKVSTQYRRDEGALGQIELLLSLYGGWLSVLPDEGVIKFGVMDLSNAPVRTIDNSHLLIRDEGRPPVTTIKGALQDTFNVIRVNYLDRDLMYENNQAEDRDEVDEDLTGTRTREFPPQFVMTRELAQWIATRALWSNLYTRDRHQFYLGWQDADLEPGDVITIVDSFSPGGLNQVAQIVRWKEIERGVFEVLAVQQLPYVAGIPMSSVSSLALEGITGGGTHANSLGYLTGSGTVSTSGITTNPSCSYISNKNGPVPAPEYFQAYELPNEFHQGDPQIFVGWRAREYAHGADLYVSADNISFAPVSRVTPYPISGRLLSDLGSNSNVAENVRVVLHPGSGYSANSPTYAFNATLNDVDASAMKMGAGLMWVGSEMVAYRNVTVISQNTYKLGYVYRGWGGTAIGAHSSGDNWHKHGGGVFNWPYTEDQIGSVLYYKVVPLNSAGYAYPVSSIAAKSYTVAGQYFKPQVPSAVEYLGTERGLTKFYVGSEVDIPIAWKDGARRSGFGTGGYGTTPTGYGTFITDTMSHAWRVLVVGSGGVVVRSTTTGSPGFTYTNSMNAADNGAWRGNVAFQVTPFSAYGDAPRTSVLSMELFK